VIRKILFVLSSEEQVSSTELALLIAMIAVFVVALILVSRYDPAERYEPAATDSRQPAPVPVPSVSAGSDHQG
jgi:hypothetical protein